jgi:Flp pilus assembly protein protease CpaA
MMGINFILDIIFISILAVCTVTDLKKRIIPSSAILCLLLLGVAQMVLLLISHSSILPNVFAVLATLPGFIPWQKGKVGGGDIKLFIGMGLYLGIWRMAIACIGMLFPCLLYLAFKFIRKEKPTRIPLAPILLVGCIFPVAIDMLLRTAK